MECVHSASGAWSGCHSLVGKEDTCAARKRRHGSGSEKKSHPGNLIYLSRDSSVTECVKLAGKKVRTVSYTDCCFKESRSTDFQQTSL